MTFKPLLCIALLFLSGCAANPDPQTETVRKIVTYGALIALDIDDLKRDGATAEERDRLRTDVNHAITLVGIDTAIGAKMTALLDAYLVAGHLDEPSWRDIVRALLEWSAAP